MRGGPGLPALIQAQVRRLRLWWLGFSVLVFLNILSGIVRYSPNHATLKSFLLVHRKYLHHDIRQYLLFALLVLISYHRRPVAWLLAVGIISWRMLNLWWNILDYRSPFSSSSLYPEFARFFNHLSFNRTAYTFFSGSNVISVIVFSLLYGYWLYQCLQVLHQLRKAEWADEVVAP